MVSLFTADIYKLNIHITYILYNSIIYLRKKSDSICLLSLTICSLEEFVTYSAFTEIEDIWTGFNDMTLELGYGMALYIPASARAHDNSDIFNIDDDEITLHCICIYRTIRNYL